MKRINPIKLMKKTNSLFTVIAYLFAGSAIGLMLGNLMVTMRKYNNLDNVAVIMFGAAVIFTFVVMGFERIIKNLRKYNEE